MPSRYPFVGAPRLLPARWCPHVHTGEHELSRGFITFDGVLNGTSVLNPGFEEPHFPERNLRKELKPLF